MKHPRDHLLRVWNPTTGMTSWNPNRRYMPCAMDVEARACPQTL
jgi:hypothetical protein